MGVHVVNWEAKRTDMLNKLVPFPAETVYRYHIIYLQIYRIFPCGAYVNEHSVITAHHNHLLTASNSEIKLWEVKTEQKSAFVGLNSTKTTPSTATPISYFDVMRGILLLLDPLTKALSVYRTKRDKRENDYIYGVVLMCRRGLEVSDKVAGLSMVVEKYDKNEIELKTVVVDDAEVKVFRFVVKNEDVPIVVNEVKLPIDVVKGDEKDENVFKLIKKVRNAPEQSVEENKAGINPQSQTAQPIMFRRKKIDEPPKKKRTDTLEEGELLSNEEPAEKSAPTQLLLKYAKLYETQSAKLDSIVI
eukprot:TRINITY_DN88831_c1_g1_i1.p1 TRINITY_DN88831_c1_g1~~TRINITY_DN88831_c1_g1_i1.p1  ORF type:complete len:303 (+),score=37.42 TRINITY_DN88831_c1_g1_i1:707-1615(+)